jgi:RimJ/RimL family protein N-acetyltransferase
VARLPACPHSMTTADIQTRRLRLVPKTLTDVRLQIDRMTSDQKSQLSSAWLAQLDATTVGPWTLGFTLQTRIGDTVIGSCGFKGPPGLDGVVEIAYGIAAEFQGQGYATEAAEAMVAYAFASDQVRVVRAHTFAADNPSTRVLAKCGFRTVGEVVDSEDGLVWRWEIRRPSESAL